MIKVFVSLVAACLALAAQAQTQFPPFSPRPITIVLAFPPGASADGLMRLNDIANLWQTQGLKLWLNARQVRHVAAHRAAVQQHTVERIAVQALHVLHIGPQLLQVLVRQPVDNPFTPYHRVTSPFLLPYFWQTDPAGILLP